MHMFLLLVPTQAFPCRLLFFLYHISLSADLLWRSTLQSSSGPSLQASLPKLTIWPGGLPYHPR